MMKNHLFGSALIPLLVLAAAPTGATGQRLEISHSARTAELVSGNVRTPFEHEDQIRILPGRSTGVRITGTNSALYVCSVDQTEVPVPETQALRDFLSKAGNLLPAIASGGISLADQAVAPGDPKPSPEEVAVSELVVRVNSAISGPRGFRQAYLETLQTLNRMRDPAQPVDALASDLKSRLLCADENCTRLTFVDVIAETLPRLRDAKRALDASKKDIITDAPAAADSILANAEGILGAAYEIQMLALIVARAESTIECDPVQVSRSTGRDLKIAVKPRDIAELKRVAVTAPLEFKVTAMPRLRPSPSVGVSLLYAPNAEYNKFGTTPVTGGARIVATDTQDERVGYGLVLGLAWNDRVGPRQPRVRVWLPEITINPTEELKTLGVGGGVSLGILKIGAGWAWQRHDELVRQEIDDVLASADLLKTKETYGRPKGYISISFMGWPPFLNPR
jgi:hypothetical protein